MLSACKRIGASIRSVVILHKTELFYYTLTAILAGIILAFVTHFHKIDWHIPIFYGGDATFYLFMFKSLLANEWLPFLNTQSHLLAAPFGLNLADFPAPAQNGNIFFVMVKMLGVFSRDYVAVFNLYFLTTFVFASGIFVYVMRKLKVDFLIAIPFGIIFAFLPYHILRIGHIFLASYFFLPLYVLVLTWIWDETPPFFKQGKFSFLNRRTIATLIIVIIGASSGTNYAFFFCFLVLIASIGSYLYNGKNRIHILSCIVIIACTTGVLFANLLPNIIYQWQHGLNALPSQHLPEQAETYGLKLANITLPPSEHRIEFLSNPSKEYQSYNDPVEGVREYLGIIALVGVFFLMFRLLFIRKVFNLYDRYAPLVLGCILLGTVGGIGSLFALLVSPMIRGYNRVSIFMATFALCALALLVQQHKHRFQKKYLVLFLSIVMIVGILDQTNASMVFSQPIKTDFISDQNFVQNIENNIPANSMIFQLPYVPFPGNPPILDMGEYSHFSGYLHSNNLRWSYGVVAGRPEADFSKEIAGLPAENLVEQLAMMNFAGIYIDRYAYADRAQTLESRLSKILSTNPIVSDTGRLSFFNIASAREQLLSQYSESELQILSGRLTAPLVQWDHGFFWLEGNAKNNWRWSEKSATLVLRNDLMESVTVSMTMNIASLFEGQSLLKISSKLFEEKITMSNTGTTFEKTFILPPGEVEIKFKSYAPEISQPDPRELNFRIINASITYNGVEPLKLPLDPAQD